MTEKELEELRAKYDTEHEVGEHNVQAFGFDMHNPVFFISSLLILIFVVGTLIFPEPANNMLDGAKSWTIEWFDWLFMIGGNIFVIFCLVMIFLPFGKIRLGGQDAKPEFSTLSWFAMLFAAGMGIGLMFWSVAEPVAYYTDWFGTPLGAEANTEAGARMAMGATMFHWGLHPWAIYGVVALALAFFAYNKDMPLTIRSAFYPILGERCWGWIGHLIDIVAVLATIFGLATSLGLGAKQAAGGLEYLFEIPNQINTQIGIIVGVTAVAVISVIRGVEGGVRVLSNFNMLVALLLLLFVIFAGATMGAFGWMAELTGAYIANIVPLSNWVGREDTTWFHGWTVFYWAWWISWSPFVGMFIARVSRGRTVREFLTAVLLVPTLVTIVWMGAFGGNAMEQAMAGVGALSEGISSVELSMFQMLDNLPLSSVTSFLGILLVLVFFVTSSDSGSLVIDTITAGGKIDAPVQQRVFWVLFEGLVAIALLVAGGTSALQALAIALGFPFTFVLLGMAGCTLYALAKEPK